MEDFWKDDFHPLQWAGKAILQALRDDEVAEDADLYRRLTQSQEGSHLYFPSDAPLPGSGSWTSTPSMSSPSPSNANRSHSQQQQQQQQPPTPPMIGLKHRQTLPLSPMLTDALKQVRTCFFLGLLAPVDMAWMSVDEKLFLFSSEDPANGSIQCFANPRKQPILTVGLVRPKPGVFKSIVEWCLVVTTPDEAILLALARVHDNLTIIQTSFLMPTDMIRMTCVAGTQQGRIFMGGDDGCVHEMVYQDETMSEYYSLSGAASAHHDPLEKDLNQFYDGTKVLPQVVTQSSSSSNVTGAVWNLGKRTWQSVSNSASDKSPRKCRKLNRTSDVPSIVSGLVPKVVRQASAAVFGATASQAGGRIKSLVVDHERKILYSLSEKGWIGVFDISRENVAPCVAVCNVPKTARLYLEAVARGQMFPPNSSSSWMGSIHFPGGGSAAQAGVGGMEGARNIIKSADWTRPTSMHNSSAQRMNNRSKTTNHPILTPTALHIIPCQDSSRLTLVAVTEAGLRFYMSSLSSNFLVSGGPVSLSNGSRSRSLGNRLSLCHIRAPPPLSMSPNRNSSGVGSSLVWSADIAGGVLPRVSGSKVGHVDASYYKNGQWVVAMAEDSASENSNCDILVAAAPDTARRPREGTEGVAISEAAAGLGESISFPVAGSRDNSRNGSEGMVTGTLSGGVVSEIDSSEGVDSGALKLLLQSTTPSNAELDVGPPPVFYPPSKVRQGPAKLNSNGVSDQNRALVAHNTTVRSHALQVATNVIMNMVFSRPLNYGLYHTQEARHQPAYRVSKRTGVNGFSQTALERRRTTTSLRTTSSTTNTAASSTNQHLKAARLRSWLLQPTTTPLNHWTKQHLLTGKRAITAINVQGVHKFEFDTILASLADALMSAGENVANDSRITSYFTGYGYKEGCSMCLALAIGCGPAEGAAGYNQQLRRRASNAALARAYKPRLMREDLQVNRLLSTLSTTNANDSCVPVGYYFKPSALCEGLFSLTSRLLRPIWNKPLVVVTEGPSLKMRWDTGAKSASAKVEILLDEKTLEDIQAPLQSLLTLVKNVFSRAIDVVPGTLGQQHMAMDIDGADNQQYFTQALQYHSQFRSTNGDSTHLDSKECDHIAHLLEERNIHSMYRLVSRVAQLLDMLSLLRKAEGIAGIPQIDWGLLHGVTVAQLTQSAEGHDRLETLLNELVVATAASPTTSPMSSQADHLAVQLAQKCYLYFPPSSRSTYQGLRLANIALSHPQGTTQRREQGDRAAAQLIDAARHWQSASLISGRIVRGSGKESYRQIAERAVQYSSPLARAAELLIKLEDVSNVVEICVATSNNFKPLKLPGGPSDAQRHGTMLAWESELYHKQTSKGNTENKSNSTDSTRQNTATDTYGTSVTPNDAIDTCYSLIFYHLDGLLRSDPRLADHMISASSSVTDKTFLTRLFEFLMESSNVDTLLRIDSPEAEAFLKKREDPNLLWRYYSVLEKFVEAGRVAFIRAKSEDNLPLGERIEWLTKALGSYRSAQKAYRRFHSRISEEELSKFVVEADDGLRLATLQDRVLRRIDGLSEFPSGLDASKYEELKMSLLDVSTMYNNIIAQVPFFDLGLVTMHMCRHDNPEAIFKLWKSTICQEIAPCATRNSETYDKLQAFAAEVDIAERIHLLDDTTEAEGLQVFEDGFWIVPLKNSVVRLGKEIYGTGADYAFPVEIIMVQMELLRRMMMGKLLTPGWPLLMMADAGVPYLSILDAYKTVMDGRSDHATIMDQASASIELLRSWLINSQTSGQGAGQHSKAHTELSRSMSTGDLMPKLNELRARLELLQDDGSRLLDELNSIERSISLHVSM